MSQTVTITGRLSFPQVFAPRAFSKTDPTSPAKFSAAFIMDPEATSQSLHATGFKGSERIEKYLIAEMKASIDRLNKAMEDALTEKYGKKVPKMTKGGIRNCADKDDKDGYEKGFFITAYSKDRPQVIDADKTPLIEADGVIYPGIYCNAVVSPWVQDNDFGKGCNWNLLLVQRVADAESFSGAAKADVDAMPDMSDDSEDEASSMLD